MAKTDWDYSLTTQKRGRVLVFSGEINLAYEPVGDDRTPAPEKIAKALAEYIGGLDASKT